MSRRREDWRRSEGSRRYEGNRRQSWTIFVGNLSKQIHWKGVWQVFNRYGQVVDVFVPTKRVRDGSRFGFVRMAIERDAKRAIEHLHRRWIYGGRIGVWLGGGRESRFGSKRMSNGNSGGFGLEEQCKELKRTNVNWNV
ncbi:hypothetical protein HRI_002703900 [Hibiscus trionum]|uniref:RRM domain-containing protein n=1 Tax=Hibiscus trionum TaxID=183268 RepID=A0A9W7I7L9_HIBTR|nr:hypothetical protein HRI_002703900 [Hibiscus trionum]